MAMACCGSVAVASPIGGTTRNSLSCLQHAVFHLRRLEYQGTDKRGPRVGHSANRPCSLSLQRRVPVCKTLSEQLGTLLSTAVTIAAMSITVTFIPVVGAEASESLGLEAGEIFQRTCAGCHSGGGNVLQSSSTLFRDDLKRNGIEDIDDIYNVTYFGKNRMPGYGEKCTPRGQCTFGPRLSEEDIRALAEFVKLQSDQDWAKAPR